MSKDADFWNKAAAKYARDPIKNQDAYDETLRRVRHYLTPQTHVLELGCGTGTTAVLLCDQVALYTGTDLSSSMIDIARERAKTAGKTNLNFHITGWQGAFSGAPTVIFASSFLHLVEEPAKVISQVFQHLPSGGYFISKTVCLAHGMGYLRLPLMVMKLFGKAPSVVQFLRKDHLDQMVVNAGFEIVEADDLPPPRTHFIVARKP